jgi:hypothetical protein
MPSDQALTYNLRQVITSTAARATAGMTAHAISIRRRGIDRTMERIIARCATPQKQTATQKSDLASAGESRRWLFIVVAERKVTDAPASVNHVIVLPPLPHAP